MGKAIADSPNSSPLMNPSVLPPPPLPSLPIQPTFPAAAHRRLAIAIDLSDESAYAVRWAVQNYLRAGDAVVLLHVRPTSVLYGADWGSITPNSKNKCENDSNNGSQQEIDKELSILTTRKANTLAQPLVDAKIPFKIHVVKDRDMKERLCLEVERLGLSAVIMGSRGFGAARRTSKGRLGSVSDYCVHHCICPVVVVRYPDEEETGKKKIAGEDAELQPVPEEELEYYDAEEEHRDTLYESE